jgi:hypothetical protein
VPGLRQKVWFCRILLKPIGSVAPRLARISRAPCLTITVRYLPSRLRSASTSCLAASFLLLPEAAAKIEMMVAIAPIPTAWATMAHTLMPVQYTVGLPNCLSDP